MSDIMLTYKARKAEEELPGLIRQYSKVLANYLNTVEILYPYAKPAWESEAEYEADLKANASGLALINNAVSDEMGDK